MSLFETARVIEGYRDELEDRAEVIERGSELVIVVADGAGGRAGGARAADTVIKDDVSVVLCRSSTGRQA